LSKVVKFLIQGVHWLFLGPIDDQLQGSFILPVVKPASIKAEFVMEAVARKPTPYLMLYMATLCRLIIMFCMYAVFWLQVEGILGFPYVNSQFPSFTSWASVILFFILIIRENYFI